MLDLVFFAVFKQATRRLSDDSTLAIMQDHARRMFRAFECAAVRSTIRDSFKCAGFGYLKASNGIYTLQFDENKGPESPEFREVSGIGFPLERLTARDQVSPWGFVDPDPVAEYTRIANLFF
jgi:hypothetical protein